MYNFGSEISAWENLILAISLLNAKKPKNLQKNYISQLLTTLSLSSIQSLILIYHVFVLQVAFLQGVRRFLQTRPLWFFHPKVSNLFCLWQIEYMKDSLLKAMQETKASFTSCIGNENHFCLKKFQSVLRTKLQVELFSFAKKLQKEARHLTRILHQKQSKKCL